MVLLMLLLLLNSYTNTNETSNIYNNKCTDTHIIIKLTLIMTLNTI